MQYIQYIIAIVSEVNLGLNPSPVTGGKSPHPSSKLFLYRTYPGRTFNLSFSYS